MNCETGRSIFNDPYSRWVNDAYLEGKKCRIHLCFIDNTQMKLSVQSIHQIAELNITSRSKVTQEEDLTWNWVLHLITERTNFVDEGVDHFRRFEVGGSLHYRDTLDDPNFNTLEIEHVRVKLNHIHPRVIITNTVRS